MSAGAAYVRSINAYVGQEPNSIHALFLDRVTDTTKPLSDVITEELTSDGELTAADIDVAAVGGIAIRGHVVPGQARRRDAIQPLLETHFVDAVVSDDKIKFVPRGGGIAATLSDDDLGAHAAGSRRPDKLRETIAAEAEVPHVIDLVYVERENHWQEGTQQAKRIDGTSRSRNQVVVQTNEVLTANEGKRIAATMLAERWIGGRTLDGALDHGHVALDPADRVQIAHDGVTDTARLLQTDFGDNYVIGVRSVVDDASIYTRFETGNLSSTIGPANLKLVSQSELFLLDTGMLRDEDDSPGLYTAARPRFDDGVDWPGGIIRTAEAFVETGNSDNPLSFSREFVELMTHLSPVRGGRIQGTALGDQARWTVIDRANSFTVNWIAGSEPTTITHAQFLNNELIVMVGEEIVCARDVTDNGDGTLTFSTLLRGRVGTEDKIANHGPGEPVLLLEPSTIRSVRLDKRSHLTGLGANRYFRVDTIGDPNPSLRETIHSNTSRRLMPLSPYYVRHAIDASTLDITISWERRTRFRDAWAAGLHAPLGEGAELYDLVVYDGTGATVARTFSSLATQSKTYTRAQQMADGNGALGAGIVAPFTNLPVGQSAGSPTLDNHDAELGTMDGWTTEAGTWSNVADSSGRPDPLDGTRMLQGEIGFRILSSQIDLANQGVATSDIDNELLAIDVRAWVGTHAQGVNLPGPNI